MCDRSRECSFLAVPCVSHCERFVGVDLRIPARVDGDVFSQSSLLSGCVDIVGITANDDLFMNPAVTRYFVSFDGKELELSCSLEEALAPLTALSVSVSAFNNIFPVNSQEWSATREDSSQGASPCAVVSIVYKSQATSIQRLNEGHSEVQKRLSFLLVFCTCI